MQTLLDINVPIFDISYETNKSPKHVINNDMYLKEMVRIRTTILKHDIQKAI